MAGELDSGAGEIANIPHPDRIADMFERRVAAATVAFQHQFNAITQLINHRIQSNKEQSDAAITAGIALSVQRHTTLKDLMDERFASENKARNLQADEYARRLDLLNHEHARMELMSTTYVRIDTNEKDWERSRADNQRDWDYLRHQRSQEAAAVVANKISQEAAEQGMRRNTLLAAISGMVALLSIGVSVLLHFTATPGLH